MKKLRYIYDFSFTFAHFEGEGGKLDWSRENKENLIFLRNFSNILRLAVQIF